MSAYLRLKPLTLALVGALLSLPATAGELCEITYQFERSAEGENADSGPFNRTTTACVESQTDCHYRAERLAREDSSAREAPPNEGGRVIPASITVTHISMEGDCDDPGGPPKMP